MKNPFIFLFLFGLFVAVGASPICCADDPAEDAGPGVTLRNDAPIYSGQAQEGDLEELTAEDFAQFGSASDLSGEQYRQYRKILEQPSSGILVPYKMKVISDDLSADDFSGFNTSEDLSEARYEAFLNMEPVMADGRTVHYVYVYHSPLPRTKSGNVSTGMYE